MDLSRLAEYGLGGVAIALIVALVIVVDKFLKYLYKKDKRDQEYLREKDKREQKFHQQMRATISKNTKLSNEFLTYQKLKNGVLNGKKKD